jgi:hypothetical protein
MKAVEVVTYVTHSIAKSFRFESLRKSNFVLTVAYPGILFGGGGGDFQQIQVWTESGDLGAVAP